MTTRIRRLRALEILDSRGNPTVSVEIKLEDGVIASAQVPSGASTGRHEAVELRDGDPGRYAGKGTRKAVENVEEILQPAVLGMEAGDQEALDRRMIEVDGTPDKSRIGANAILGVSCAAARAAAIAQGVSLWSHLKGKRTACLPVPMVNILSGGLHAGRQFEFQDFLATPHGFDTYAEALCAVAAIHRATRDILDERGCILTGVADEGGWGPRLPSNETALEVLATAIERAGYRPGEQVSIAIDVAASHFLRDGAYYLRSEDRTLSPGEMIDMLAAWSARFPVFSIEDGLAEDDWEGWRALTGRLGRLQLLGDDFFTTNPVRLERGIREGMANAVLVKMNQIGTLTETFHVIDMARQAGYNAVISARSGETEDSFLADLAVASGAGQIKIGSITRSERLAKYNRLLEIEQWSKLPYFRLMVPRHFGDPQKQGTFSTSRSK
jgi:enolase